MKIQTKMSGKLVIKSHSSTAALSWSEMEARYLAELWSVICNAGFCSFSLIYFFLCCDSNVLRIFLI